MTREQTIIKGDQLVDRAASRLQELAGRAAAEGGFAAKLAQPLADDAAFLRKLKPSLIRARVRGEAPTNGRPTAGVVPRPVAADPELGSRPSKKRGAGGPSPFLIVGVAFVAGIVLAKVIDWKGRAEG